MWSNPDLSWGGFTAVEYSLDTVRVLALPLLAGHDRSAPTGVTTTVSDLLEQLRDREVKEITPRVIGGHAATVATDSGDVTVPCSPFCAHLISTLLQFRREGVNPDDTSWFWYDRDSVTNDPQERYSFFVVHGDRIVRERVSFSDHSHSGFDPTIFVSDADGDSIWLSDEGVRAARLRFWYRKFYRETMIGQMMVLRSDEPDVFHYPEGQLLRLLYASRTMECDRRPGRESETVCQMLASVLLGK